MKKTSLLLIFILTSFISTAYSYDGRLLARNCVGADVSAEQLPLVETTLKEIGINYTVAKDVREVTDYRVVAMARNGMLKIDLAEKDVYFKLSKKILKVLESDVLLENEVDFNFTTIGECLKFSK